MGIIKMDAGIMQIPIVAFDLETTGLNAGSDKILEIGAIKFQNQVTFSTFETLVDPEIPIPPETTKIHGINDAMVTGKPTIESVLPPFLDFIRDCVLIAHNIPFDLSFIEAALREQHLPSLTCPQVDTLLLSRKALPGQPNYKLQSLAAYFKINPGNAHRAKDDAALCRDIFYCCLARIQDSKSLSLEKLLAFAK